MVFSDENSNVKLIQYKVVLSVLSNRYKECNTNGHKKPSKASNLCNYCYRHLNYTSKKADSILDSRKDLPLTQQPSDASYLQNLREEEIENMKNLDLMKGLSRLIDELEIV